MACDATNNLAMAMLEGGDLGGALPLLRRTLEVSRGSLSDRHPSTHTSVNNLGLVLKKGGELEEAEQPAATSSAPRTRTPSTRPSTSRGEGRHRRSRAALPRGASGAAVYRQQPAPSRPQRHARPLHSALPARPRGGGESPLPRRTWHRS
mmetsp:Transcript_36404/g.117304  ORF Transcript_36404/g.117304 Transcript_36404/m.117304 type:complete len:150 (+) Transcript_36404:360-809(+)